ncbi:MAG: helix-turn-helix domain-containing protein [Spirochaetes bacterium]|nr:helix-turn-helix domain-containing protein [Spirochaetota bacterium]
MSVWIDFCIFSSTICYEMNDNPFIFWENVKKEVKAQNTTHEWVAKNSGISFNTFQGWISKGIYPRVNEAIRIAVSLNTSVEYLASGAVQNNKKPIDIICQHLPKIQEHLEAIKGAVKELQ